MYNSDKLTLSVKAHMKKLSQKGFSLIEGLLVVIALCLIVGVGFYVYNSTQKDEKPVTTTSTQTIKSTAVEKMYLEVPELGVKFELTDKLENAYYKKINGYYYVSVKELDNTCPAGGSTDGLGIMALVTGKVGEKNDTIAAETTWTQAELEQTGFKEVGDTYYGFMRGNGPCYDPNAANAEELAKQVDEYRKAFVAQQSTIQKL